MKRLIAVCWASIQFTAHVNGATIHVTGPDERQVEFGDGTTSFATLSGGEGFINSTVTVNAPDFVTMTGTSANEMWALLRDQQAIIVSQQVEIDTLKQHVGMLPPSSPPSLPPALPPFSPEVTFGEAKGSMVSPAAGQLTLPSTATNSWDNVIFSSTPIMSLDDPRKGASITCSDTAHWAAALRPATYAAGQFQAEGDGVFWDGPPDVGTHPKQQSPGEIHGPADGDWAWVAPFSDSNVPAWKGKSVEIRINDAEGTVDFAVGGQVYGSTAQLDPPRVLTQFPYYLGISIHAYPNAACSVRWLSAADAASW